MTPQGTAALLAKHYTQISRSLNAMCVTIAFKLLDEPYQEV